MSEVYTTEKYCFYSDGVYHDFCDSPRVLRMYDDQPPENVRKVRFTADTSIDDKRNGFWGFYDFKDQDFILIYQGYNVLSICFPSGVEAEVQRNKGFVSGLRLEEIDISETEQLAGSSYRV